MYATEANPVLDYMLIHTLCHKRRLSHNRKKMVTIIQTNEITRHWNTEDTGITLDLSSIQYRITEWLRLEETSESI